MQPLYICIFLFAQWPVIANADAPASASASRLNEILQSDAVDAGALAAQRGGTDVASTAAQDGAVSGNRATNTVSGGNVIASGAFANASGLPMVIQNSGNNVLIQNSTIVNVQFK
jgi:hypothetical protein